MVEYVKEFEQYILSENKEEPIMTMIPGSSTDQFFQITQKLNNTNEEFPQSLISEIEKFKKINEDTYILLKIHSILREYDLPCTTQERKLKLIEMIKKNILKNELFFDYPKPSNQNEGNEYEGSVNFTENNQQDVISKVEDKLNEKLFDPTEEIKKFNEEEGENMYSLMKFKPEYAMMYFDPKLISEEKLKFMMKDIRKLAFLRYNDDFMSYVYKFFESLKEDDPYLNDPTELLSLLSLEETEQLLNHLKQNDNKKIDLNIFYISIIERKYKMLLDNTEDESEERQILLNIYEFIKDKSASKNNILKQDILLQILENGIPLNNYDFNYFIEYLKLPTVQDISIFKYSEQMNKDFYTQKSRSFCNYTFKNNNEVVNIVSSYLEYFFLHEKKTIEEFHEFLSYDYLNREYQKALIFRGEENEQTVKNLFGQNYYEQLLKKVDINICKHNKKNFKVDELVVLDIDIKNVQTLFVKIYEINTENYFLTKKSEISSVISLEGLIATFEESWSFSEKPQILTRKRFELDKIPLRRGFYIIELIGGGYSSRAVIKKGFLSVIQRNTDLGKMLFILNEKSEICNTNEKTGIWFKERFYTPNQEGAILIPYMKTFTSDKAILLHENFAEISTLEIPEEKYVLNGAVIINHESLIMGNTAKVIFRPKLKINGMDTSLALLKNCKINLLLTKIEGDSNIPISNVYDNLSVNKEQDVEIEFQVPPKLISLDFKFECEIRNNSKETVENLSYNDTYRLETSNDEQNVVKFYVRQDTDNNFVLYAMGRNAEPKSNIIVYLSITHKAFVNQFEVNLRTNSEGKIYLGKLIDVIGIKFSSNKNDGAEVYNTNLDFIVPKRSLFFYPSNIDIIENEIIKLPYHKSSVDMKSVQLLNLNLNPPEQANNKLNIIQTDQSHFYIEIKDLTEGSYTLRIIGIKNININVHKGEYWRDSPNFILKKDMLVETQSYKNPINIEKLEIIRNQDDPSKSSIKIKINVDTISPRINLNLYQFLSNFTHYNSKNIKKTLNDGSSIHHGFKKWINEFKINRELNEEIQYVFDRKQLERFMGNSLEKPSMLMKRQFVRDTTVMIQEAKKGTEYKEEKFQVKRIRNKSRKECEDDSPRNYRDYADRELCRRGSNNDFWNWILKEGDIEDREQIAVPNLSGYHNWLVDAPLIINNLKPDEKGEILIENVNINKYGFLHIVCSDEKSVSEEIVPLGGEFEKKDISLNETLELNKFFAEIKKIENLQKGKNYYIKDIVSTKLKIIDSLEKVASFQTLLNSSLKNSWSKFNYILKFDQLSVEEQKKKFSEFFSHELNIFLFFRYPAIFKEFVQPILKYKIEKSFIDYFLLNEENVLMQYTNSQKLSTLNTFEKCLLILVIRDKKPNLADSIANSIYQDGLDKKPNPSTMNKYFNVIMNLKTQELDEIMDFSASVNESVPMMSFCAMPAKTNLESVMRSAPKMMMKKAVGSNRLLEKKCDIFGKSASSYSQEIEQMNRRNNLYNDNGKSKEYRETHYYSSSNHNIQVNNNLFWGDLAKFWVEGNNHGFLSQNILLPCQSITELIFLLSVLSLPVSSLNHQYNRKEGSALEIVNNSDLILFTNQIAETTSDITKELMISQHVSKFQLSNTNEKVTVKDFLINEYYRHETIVTNISSNKVNFELLIQIPLNAVPIKGSDYTKITSQTLEKFNTISIETIFYFPKIGTFTQFPPNASVDGIVVASGVPLNYEVKEKAQIDIENQTLDDVLLNGTKKSIIEFFSNLKTVKLVDLNKIYWMLKDVECFNSIISILKQKGFYDHTVWSFGFFHNNEVIIKEYLENNELFRNAVGPNYKSSLIELDESNNYSINYHLDYHPVINARTHYLDRNTSILNKQFKQTYQEFIMYLLLQKTISNKDLLRLSYYLILQDRVEDAFRMFKKIDQSNPSFSNIQMQYDYILAYLDFYTGYPEFKQAREICKRYKNIPLTHWNELFEEIEDQLIEYGGEEIYGDMDKLIDQEKKKKQLTKEVIATEPKLTFSIENKNLQIIYSNLASINIKFYFIDLEILFSRRPFLKQESDDFSFVVPNFVQVLNTGNSTKEEVLNFPIPDEFISRNLFIEVSSLTKKNFDTYFSTNLKISITENLGEVKVTDMNLKPLNKVYVKCFAKIKNEIVKFYKDGYTDLRGRFNYITLNTDALSDITKFAVFIIDDNYGSIIKEINPPANISPSSNTGENVGYEEWKNYRQELKTQWKSQAHK